MANERQREIGRWIRERYPRGDYAQREFRMALNAYLQCGKPELEAVTLSIAFVRQHHPDFTPAEHQATLP